MSAVISWARANAAWLQSLLIAGLTISADFGVHMTQAQETDLISFSAVALGIGAHMASKGQNT